MFHWKNVENANQRLKKEAFFQWKRPFFPWKWAPGGNNLEGRPWRPQRLWITYSKCTHRKILWVLQTNSFEELGRPSLAFFYYLSRYGVLCLFPWFLRSELIWTIAKIALIRVSVERRLQHGDNNVNSLTDDIVNTSSLCYLLGLFNISKMHIKINLRETTKKLTHLASDSVTIWSASSLSMSSASLRYFSWSNLVMIEVRSLQRSSSLYSVSSREAIAS